MENGIVSMVVAFIMIAIVLSIGVTILGQTSGGFDCYSLDGGNKTAKTAADNSWAKNCLDVQKQSQSSFLLLIVILVVVAAAAIIMVVRMF